MQGARRPHLVGPRQQTSAMCPTDYLCRQWASVLAAPVRTVCAGVQMRLTADARPPPGWRDGAGRAWHEHCGAPGDTHGGSATIVGTMEGMMRSRQIRTLTLGALVFAVGCAQPSGVGVPGTWNNSTRAKSLLRSSDMAGVNLAGMDLSAHDLSGANMPNANLRRADLHGSVMAEAKLQGANLEDADLRSADLRSVHLQGANLRGARLGRLSMDSDPVTMQFAKLRRATLEGADLTDAILTRAILDHANLRGATLIGADLRGVDFSTADTTGAKFAQARYDGRTVFPPRFDPIGARMVKTPTTAR